jgi:hypothetical protein
MRQVVCIDPGITSVGLVAGYINQDGTAAAVHTCAVVNIMDCTGSLFTARHVHTYISNFFHDYNDLFAAADDIVIERQPPQSAGAPVELLFRERFGSKCVFIHPATLHSRFKLMGYTYDGRKQRSVLLAQDFLSSIQATRALESMAAMERQHDCADACLLFIMRLEQIAAEVVKTKAPTVIPETYTDFQTFIESYRYVKK